MTALGAKMAPEETGAAARPLAGLTETAASAIETARASRRAVSHCPHARRGVAFYRQRYRSHRAVRGIETPHPAGRKPRNCADAHYLAEVWPARALTERRITERWLDARMLKETPSYREAVERVQVLFPGTEGWLISCADAEGWNESTDTIWFTYGHGRYYPGFEDLYVVGGPLQFKWPTFKGMYRNALEFAIERGFRVPAHLRDPGDVRAWLSMLGQAMAGGWARYTGEDDAHWSASWGSGC